MLFAENFRSVIGAVKALNTVWLFCLALFIVHIIIIVIPIAPFVFDDIMISHNVGNVNILCKKYKTNNFQLFFGSL